jgi:hypothetical protein
MEDEDLQESDLPEENLKLYNKQQKYLSIITIVSEMNIFITFNCHRWLVTI